MAKNDEIAYELDDNQIIAACSATYFENRDSPDIESIINRAAEYAKTVKGKKPRKGTFVSPAGLMGIESKFFEDPATAMELFCDGLEEDAFEEGLREWNYILGFYIAMNDLSDKKLLVSPYSKKEMKRLLDNTVLIMRFITDEYRKRQAANT